ncbi:MAG TPA: AMP-binding protein, partial [Accumulibacter sp.]|nr:AMP-binding protein [Accumulibacter sp.]
MSYSAFVQARDFLQAHRTDYETAYRDFKWPQLTEFNWALDYFDVAAANNDRLALWVVNEDGSEQKMTYAQMSKRSNQVANWLRGIGVKRGDRILMMLGNEVSLWDTMLASIKLGAVLTPATTLLAPDDLRDRLDRGQVRHVIIGHVHAEKFASLPGDYSRVTVGGAVPGWLQLEKAYLESEEFQPNGVTLATDPQLLYFTSGTTSKPKLVLHSQQSYPVGHLSTMYWLGLQPGDIHWNISSPGWAKHAWSCFFAPWNARATIFIYNYSRFVGSAILETLVRCAVTTLCAPPTVWRMMIQEDLAKYPVKLRELIGA